MIARIALVAAVVLAAAIAQSPTAPVPAGPVPMILPPAIDDGGTVVVFAGTIAPTGKYDFALNLYKANLRDGSVVRLKEFSGASAIAGATAVSITPDAALAAYTAGEEVHLLATATAEDRLLAVNKEPCVHIMLYCPACIFTCTGSPHVASDGSRVLYAAKSDHPFWVAAVDGGGLQNLKVYTGTVAPSPQRVLSRSGTLVFSSSAPFGPTFAAAAADLYAMNIGGGEPAALTQFGNPNVFARNAAVSDDGKVVVFESNYDPAAPDKTGVTQIWTVKTDGTGHAPLTSGPDPAGQPSLSADGKTAAFVRAGQLWIVRTDGGEPSRLTSLPFVTVRDPAISGDGARVVFLTGAQNGAGTAVLAVNADGTGLGAVYSPPVVNTSRESHGGKLRSGSSR